MKKNKNSVSKKQILAIIGTLIISVFALLVVRVTYAYYGPGSHAEALNIRVHGGTVDDLKFFVGEPLSIAVTPTTLGSDGKNLEIRSTSKATLTAGVDGAKVSFNYYTYLELKENSFIYSDGSTPEIILSVIGTNGEEITDIEGLNYGTFNGVSGFDVTTKEGTFLLEMPTIESSSTTEATTQEITIVLTYLNLLIDQQANLGNSLKTNIMMKNSPISENITEGE